MTGFILTIIFIALSYICFVAAALRWLERHGRMSLSPVAPRHSGLARATPSGVKV